MRPLRVLHIVAGLPIGGAERMLEDVIAHTKSAMLSHRVLSLQGDGPMQPLLERAGAAVDCVHKGSLGRSFASVKVLHAGIKRFAPNIVHGWTYPGNLAALGIKRGVVPEAALVWGIHSVAPFWPRMGLRRRAQGHLCRLASGDVDALVYVAKTSAAAHARAGYCRDTPFEVIAGGVDTTRFVASSEARRRLRQRLQIAPDTQLIGMLARRHPMKAHEVLLDAAALWLESAAGLAPQSHRHLLVVGAGFEQVPQDLVHRLSAHQHCQVHFLGAQDDAAAIVQGLDVCTLSSSQEALPKVLLEALSAQTLVVATAVGDVPRLVAGAGWSCPPGAPKALCEGWQQALACAPDEAQARRHLGRARIVADFGQMQFASAMTRLYRSLVL